jgi:O-antigen/teichoic acid export membrane protein
VPLTHLKTLNSSTVRRRMIFSAARAASHDEAQERAQRGTRQFLLARFCVVLFGYGATAILSRQLGPTVYGIYGVVISQVLWLEMLNNSGVAAAIAKLTADGQHDHGDIERSARTLLIGLSGLVLAVCWFMAPQVAELMQIPDGEMLFRIALMDLPFMAIFTFYDGILNGRRQFGFLAGAHVLYGMTKLTGVVALIGLGFSIERALIVFVLSTCVVCTVLVIRYPPHGFQPSARVIGKIVILTAPIALYLVSSQVLLNLDLWSLKSLWEGEGQVVGEYVASTNLAKILMVIPGAQAGVIFTSVAWAVAARDAARAQRHIYEATRFAVIIAAAAWVILVLNATEVLSLLYSRAYADGQRFLPLQLAGFGLFALIDAFSQGLMAAGRRWFVAGVLIAIVPFVWLSNYLLIPRLDAVGAAIAMLLGTAIGTALIGALAYRCFGSLVQSSMLLRVFVAAVVVGLVSAVCPVRGPVVILKLALLGGLYLLVLYMLGEVTGKDIRFLRKSPDDPPT